MPKDSANSRPHIPVMLTEVIEALDPKAGETYVDGTFGAGGYTSAILNHAQCNVVAIDRDPGAVASGQALVKFFSPRLTLIQDCFGNIANIVHNKVNGFVLDIGVSSMQIDQADRGFSFQKDGPLDMRMGGGESAADLLARLEETDLADIIYNYGEDRNARRIAKAIVAEQKVAAITTTLHLADVIARACPRKHGDKIHPATRTFQALRIAVNDELGELERALKASLNILAPGGRLVVVTFHSLEDRIVKNFLRDHSEKHEAKNKYSVHDDHPTQPFVLLTKKVVMASEAESAVNPRARSAKLRAAIRTEVAA